jgi:hypothetical protein
MWVEQPCAVAVEAMASVPAAHTAAEEESSGWFAVKPSGADTPEDSDTPAVVEAAALVAAMPEAALPGIAEAALPEIAEHLSEQGTAVSLPAERARDTLPQQPAEHAPRNTGTRSLMAVLRVRIADKPN